MVLIIGNPTGPGEIDVTGWNLAALEDTLATLEADIMLGSARPLTEDEVEVLTDNVYGLRAEEWTRELDEEDVMAAVDRIRLIVNEAIYQRDLAEALRRKATGEPLSQAQADAYSVYIETINA